MSAKPPKPPIVQPWDRRPWPSDGDVDEDKLYAAIGRFLSEWERYESILSFVFAAFVTSEHFAIARRAYSAVRTFEGRADMLRASSQTYFYLHPDEPLQEQFKAIIKAAASFSPRRNDIAHGAVDRYLHEPPLLAPVPRSDKFALFPSFATFKDRDVEGVPTYCYTTNELEYFRMEFLKLRNPAAQLASHIGHVSRMRTLRDTHRALSQASANPGPDHNDLLE
jgi:hypothetical protein